MQYPLRKEFKKYAWIKPSMNKCFLKIANAFMPLIQRGKRLDKSLKKRIINLPNCSATLIAPKEKETSSLLVYYHGGGFVLKASSYHKNLTQFYCKKADCAVLFVNYRLAPKYKFPKPLEDCFDAYRWALEQRQYLKIVVGGDSAGANLSLAVIQMAQKNFLQLPSAQMLVYPLADTRMKTVSMQIFTNTPLWNNSLNLQALQLYADKCDYHNSLISILEAEDLSFMPPTYVETAEFDCLHDDGINLANRLIDEKVEITLNETKGTMHGYDIAEKSPYVKEQVQKRINFLCKQFQ